MDEDIWDIDCAVIGAGVVGLACAAALARRGRDVVVLEAGAQIGAGISSRNSEVIHAGIYYPNGSLKHRLCVTGRRRLYPYLASRGVDHRKCGKLIVATSAPEEAKIAALHETALANGVENVELISGAQARKLEPAVVCSSALVSHETGIVDSHGLMLALQGDLENAGGVVVLSAPLLRGQVCGDGAVELHIGGAGAARIRCRSVVNAAGLYAQDIARRIDGAGASAPPLVLAKGNYFTCVGKPAFSRLIYPAQVDGGLGVHLTIDLAGNMRFGPDVEWLDSTDPDTVNYHVDPRRSASFYEAIRRYWPGLADGALAPDYAGCRPKLSGPGAPAADFRIDGPETHGVAGLMHLFGIESPGLTSCMAIAEEVAARLNGQTPSFARALRPVVFFDRDGTLNAEIGYAHRTEDLQWMEGAQEAISEVNARGWLAIVVTNQSGIGRGLYDEAAMHTFHRRMNEDLTRVGAHIDAFYFCPHHSEATIEAYRHVDHPDRKPNPGMILRAFADWPADPSRALMIGDSERDADAAKAAGIAAAHFLGGNLRDALLDALARTSWAATR